MFPRMAISDLPDAVPHFTSEVPQPPLDPQESLHRAAIYTGMDVHGPKLHAKKHASQA